MKDDLGRRIKESYENRACFFLPRRTYTVVRVDGKAFHSFTRGMDRPFDANLIEWMNQTAKSLCEEIQGVRFAYVQSDEISLLLTDFGGRSEAWFDGNLSKMVSISASIATSAFASARRQFPTPCFDSRAFTIPDPVEVANYFIWRQQDATRNAIQMVAHANFSHKRLVGVTANQMQEMLWSEKGVNFNDFPAHLKRGRFVERITTQKSVEYTDKRTGKRHQADNVLRSEWVVIAPPIFTRSPEFLASRIPLHPTRPEPGSTDRIDDTPPPTDQQGARLPDQSSGS